MTHRNTKKLKLITAIFSSILFLAGNQCVAQTGRQHENFDGDWLFHKGDIKIKRAIKAGQFGGITDGTLKLISGEEAVIAYTDKNKVSSFKQSEWQDVNLPHDWLVTENFVHDDNISSQPASNGYLPAGVGFYRKEFEIPDSDKGKKINIEFDGVFRNSTVWVNGHLLGNHLSGYTPFNYELTEVLRYGKEGKNVILVKVDATDFEGWWYEGCGIYRHVWLNKTAPLHIARFGTFVTTPEVATDKAIVKIQTTLQNEYQESKAITLISKILNQKGEVLNTQTSTLNIESGKQIEIDQKADIIRPNLWSPESPNLYKLLTTILDNGKPVDSYETTFGVRTIQYTNEGFFLNGKRYLIKGTANHQDFAGVGVALPDKLNEYKIKLLKEMGCNGYRCAHNPPTPELLDICDRLGMLVLDENRLLSATKDGLDDLSTLIYRDRNHPSVFMWNMENEESLEGNITGTRIIAKMVEKAHELDPTRLTTAAMNHGWNEAGYSDAIDVVGYNYGQRGMQYVKDREKFPQRKMLVTESTSFVSTRGEYADNKEKGYVSNLGKGVGWGMLPGKDWEHIIQYPYLSGMFAWTGFDYRGEPTPYRWPCVTSHFGIMDICGFPKDGYYAYKAAWIDSPLVHIFPHWNWQGKEGQKIDVGCYTNCQEVELFLNGKSLGKKVAVPFNQLRWEVNYYPGKLEAKGYNNGKVVAKQLIETAAAPSRIAIESDTKTLRADGQDVAVVNISIKDAKGRIVPIADNLIKFNIEGPGKIIGTGNGNPSSHEPDKASQRQAFNGHCQVLVQSEKMSGQIRIEATSADLKNATILLNVQQK